MFLRKVKSKIFVEKSGFNLDKGVITFLNPFSYLKLRSSSVDLSHIHTIMIDGIFLVYCLRLIGINCKRRSFDMTSVAPILFTKCQEEELSIYFIGSRQQEIEEAVRNIKKEYPKLNIVGYNNGYVNDEDLKKISTLLEDKEVDFLIVGMGTPLQEQVAIKFMQIGYAGTIFTCGGFLHQTSASVNYYPQWIDKLNLRWLYRIYDEPKLLKRYLFYYPLFIFIFISDVFSLVLNKEKTSVR